MCAASGNAGMLDLVQELQWVHDNIEAFGGDPGKAPVYMYLFAWRSPALGGKMGAPHTVEIPFVFDNPDIPKVMTTGSPKEKALAAKTSEAWIQFARSCNPNHK
jgi:para-nitrobenzyl esterase